MSICHHPRYLCIVTVVFLSVVVSELVLADTPRQSIHSLFGYRGLNMIPTAYITDGELALHYTHLPRPVAFQGNNGGKNNCSDNDIYSVTLGMFPFIEGFLMVTVEPDRNVSNLIDNFGANKFRSIGGKLQFLSETSRRPAMALCVFDPNLKKLGATKSANSISSTCLVASKSFGLVVMTAGYGDDQFEGELSRLNGLFGGASFSVGPHVAVIIDYDTEYFSEGLQITWRGIEAHGCLVDGDSFAFRVGYGLNLLQNR